VRGHRMGFQSLLVLPEFDDREVVLATVLLQDLKVQSAILAAARGGQLLQHGNGVILGRRNGVGVGHDIRGSWNAYGPRGTSHKCGVWTLIVWTDAERPQRFVTLSRVRSHCMGFESLLVLPELHEREMIRSPALLQYLETPMARICAACRTVLPEHSGGLARRRWPDFEVCHHVDGRIPCLICTRCLLLTHRLALLLMTGNAGSSPFIAATNDPSRRGVPVHQPSGGQANRKMTVATQVEVLVVPKRAGCQLQGSACGEHKGKGDAALEAGERRASAIMVAVPEGEVMIRLAGDIETVRFGEVTVVAIGCSQHGQDEVAAADRLAAAFHVFGGNAAHELHGAVVPQELFDSHGNRPEVVPKPLQLVGVLEQRDEAVTQQVGGCLIARVEQE
jgi:hypothetical protein